MEKVSNSSLLVVKNNGLGFLIVNSTLFTMVRNVQSSFYDYYFYIIVELIIHSQMHTKNPAIIRSLEL